MCHAQGFTGIHGHYTLNLLSGRGIDADDPCMSIWAEHQAGVQQPGYWHITCVTSKSADLSAASLRRVRLPTAKFWPVVSIVCAIKILLQHVLLVKVLGAGNHRHH